MGAAWDWEDGKEEPTVALTETEDMAVQNQ